MKDSAWNFKRGEFKSYIQNQPDTSVPVAEIFEMWREHQCLRKKFKQITVKESADDPQLINELWEDLHKMAAESKYKLPYKKEERQAELIENLSENYHINKTQAQVKILTGHHKNEDTGQEFNYTLEVVVAPREDKGVESAGEVEIVGNVNSTPAIDGGEGYFYGGKYNWDHKGQCMNATSVHQLLSECGFNTTESITKRRAPSVVYLNLKTPCPDWLGSAGKTKIDVKPYQQDIAKTLSTLAYKIPSYHGKGHRATIQYNYSREKSAQDYLDDFLRKRLGEIRANPSLKTKDRITQRGAWYRIRPIMVQEGFEPKKNWGTTAEYIASIIKKRCKELFGLTREDLGIIASSRATMYYMGNHYPVNIDNFRELARNGVAIIVIEKEGIADLFYEFADKYGVALVHTQGRFTEDGKELIEAVKEYGSFIGILVDFDAVGNEIPKATITKTPIIGINKSTITWLQQNGYEIIMPDVEEEYTPNIRTSDPYLQSYRIELDSVAQKVGAEALWKYVMYRVKELAAPDGLDYRNVISKPSVELLYQADLSESLSYLNRYANHVTKPDWDKIEEELSNVPELINIEIKNNEIDGILSPKLTNDPGMQLVAKTLKELVEKLPKVEEDEDERDNDT